MIVNFFHGKEWRVLKPRLEKGDNAEFWIKKITKNQERDVEIDKELLFLGWTVIRFWGEEILENADKCINIIEETIFDLMIEGYEE